MSHSLIVFMSPSRDEKPRAGSHGYPEIVFGHIESPTLVKLSFDALADPAGYLRDLASIALGLAEQFDARDAA